VPVHEFDQLVVHGLGVSRRTFKPNLQRIHIWLPNGKTTHITVATS